MSRDKLMDLAKRAVSAEQALIACKAQKEIWKDKAIGLEAILRARDITIAQLSKTLEEKTS